MLAFSWEFFFSFRFTRPVVEGNHSLMGGSADALHLGAVLSFVLSGPCFAFFSDFGCFWVEGFFLPPLGACPGG